MPTPIPGGTLDELRGHLPPTLTDRDYLLIIGAVISWLNPTIGYPILALRGSQASGKSVTARMVQKLIDPQVTDECGLPQKDEDLALAANSSWTLSFGNLGTIRERLSNQLCRIATGGAFRCRKLYGQNEECIYRFRRPVILNGIGNFMTRGDLLSRTYLIDLEPLTGRKTEAELWRTFDAAHPRLLGSLLDAASAGLKSAPCEDLKSRMADAEDWANRCFTGLGRTPGCFSAAVAEVQSASTIDTLEAFAPWPYIEALSLMGKRWTVGTLLVEINKLADGSRHVYEKSWPTTESVLGTRLKENLEAMQAAGVWIERDKSRSTGKRWFRLYQIVNAAG